MNPFLASLIGGYGSYAGTQPQQQQNSFFAPFDLSGYQTPNIVSEQEIQRRAQEERMRNFWLGLSQGALTGQWGGVGKGIGAGLVAGNQAAGAEEDKWQKYNDALRKEALDRQRLAMEEQFRKPQAEMNVLQLGEAKRKLGEDEKIRSLAQTDIPGMIGQAEQYAKDWVQQAGSNKEVAAARFAEARSRLAELNALGERAKIDESYYEKFKSSFDTSVNQFGAGGSALDKTQAEIADEAAKMGMSVDEWIKFNKRKNVSSVNYTEAMVNRLGKEGQSDAGGMKSPTTVIAAVTAQRKILEDSFDDLQRAMSAEHGINAEGKSALIKWGLYDPSFLSPSDPTNPSGGVVLNAAGKTAVENAIAMGEDYVQMQAEKRAAAALESGVNLFSGLKSKKSGEIGDVTGEPMKTPIPKTIDEAIRMNPNIKAKVEAARKEGWNDDFIMSEILKDGMRVGLWTREDILGNR